MLNGTVILAHSDSLLTAGAERILYMNHPGLHVERTQTGREALAMQAVMRADAVLMDANLPDMPGAHLVQALKRDIARPFVLWCSPERGEQAERRALRLGADRYMPSPIDLVRTCDLIGEQLKIRASGLSDGGLPEMLLQRIFADNGIPCDLKGYAFLKHALALLHAGQARLDCMRALYARIAERFGCTPEAVEHAVRYAVGICAERMALEGGRIGNRQFIARLLEESESAHSSLLKPRVSVFCSGRRVFR